MAGYVYILASPKHGTTYVGVTSDLVKRVSEHRSGAVPGFTRRHGVKLLVFVETHHGIEVAIKREKQIKEWQHDWKIRRIERENPEWDDLAVSLLGFGPLPVPKPHHRHSGKGRDPRTRNWE